MAKPGKPDSVDTGTSDEEVTIPNRVLMVNPLSKGNLGKTTFYEYLTACLEESGIVWAGANMDNRHLMWQQSHPVVKNFFAENSQAIDEYQPVFSAVRRSTASLYLIDQRAQADLAFLQSARDTGFLRSCQENSVRIVPVCIAINDLDYIQNLDETVAAFLDEGIERWIVVRQPGRLANEVFVRSPLMKQLTHMGAAVIDMPYLSKTTMARYSGLNAGEGGPYSYRSALETDAFKRDGTCHFEMQRQIGKMAVQFRQHADLILPDGVEFSPLEDLNKLGWTVAPSAAANPDSACTRRAALSNTFLEDQE